jgi:hypothetical protein
MGPQKALIVTPSQDVISSMHHDMFPFGCFVPLLHVCGDDLYLIIAVRLK